MKSHNMAATLTLLLLVLPIYAAQEHPDKLPIRKCCQENEGFDLVRKICREMPNNTFYGDIVANYEVDRPVQVMKYGNEKCNENSTMHLIINNHEDVGTQNGFITFINLENQSLMLADAADAELYPDFCLERYFYFASSTNVRHLGTVAIACKTKQEVYCQHNHCLQYCCDWGQYLHPELKTCQDHPPEVQEWRPEEFSQAPVKSIYQELDCNFTLIHPKEKFEIKFLANNDLDIEGVLYEFGTYCINQVVNATTREEIIEIKRCHDPSKAGDMECTGNYGAWFCLVDLQIIPALFVVSIIFYLFLLVHIFNHQKEKLFGWLMFFAILMLLIFYFVLAVAKLAGRSHLENYPILCELEALTIQYSYMSALFWLSTLSHFTWRTFKKIRPRKDTLRGLNVTHYGFQDPPFKKYALYSWGCPLIVTIVTLVMQHLPMKLDEKVTRPDIGVIQCYFGSDEATLFYFHIINAPVLLGNLFFFLLFLWSMMCGTWANSKGDPVVSQQNKKKIKAVVKMFFVMGITWIAEIVSWGLAWTQGPHKVYKKAFFFQLINASQGFIMFCVIYFDSAKIKTILEYLNLRSSVPSASVRASTNPNHTQSLELGKLSTTQQS